MLKINSIGDIYCLSCGEEQEGVLLDSNYERPDLSGESCVECERVFL